MSTWSREAYVKRPHGPSMVHRVGCQRLTGCQHGKGRLVSEFIGCKNDPGGECQRLQGVYKAQGGGCQRSRSASII